MMLYNEDAQVKEAIAGEDLKNGVLLTVIDRELYMLRYYPETTVRIVGIATADAKKGELAQYVTVGPISHIQIQSADDD